MGNPHKQPLPTTPDEDVTPDKMIEIINPSTSTPTYASARQLFEQAAAPYLALIPEEDRVDSYVVSWDDDAGWTMIAPNGDPLSAAQILAALLTVDVDNSGLNATTLQGVTPTDIAGWDTAVGLAAAADATSKAAAAVSTAAADATSKANAAQAAAIAASQPVNNDLTSIGGLTSAANKMLYATALDTWALADLSAFARTVLDDSSAAAMRTTLGISSATGLVVSVADYGAVGDHTTDDWAAITAAIAAVKPGGTLVLTPTQTGRTEYSVSKPLIIPPDITIEGGGYGKVSALYSGISISIHSTAAAADWKKMGVLTSYIYRNGTTGDIPDGPVIIRNIRIDGRDTGLGNALVLQNKQVTVENYHFTGFTGATAWDSTAVGVTGTGHGYGIVMSGKFYDGTSGSTSNGAVDCRFFDGQIQSQMSRFYTIAPTGGTMFTDGTIRGLNLMIQPGSATAADDIDMAGAGGWLFDGLHSNGSGRHTVRLRNVMNTRIVNCFLDGWGVGDTSSATNACVRVDQFATGGGVTAGPGLIVANCNFRWREEQDSPGTYMAAWIETGTTGHGKALFANNTGHGQEGGTGTYKGFRIKGDVANSNTLTISFIGNLFPDLPLNSIFENSMTTGDGVNVVVYQDGNSWQRAAVVPAAGNWPKYTRIDNSALAIGLPERWTNITAGAPGTWLASAPAGVKVVTDWTLPTSAVAQTTPRNAHQADLAMLSTGRLSLFGVYLAEGQIVTTITFLSGATALSVGSNQWFALYSAARGKLAVTNDDTSTAWGQNALKTLTLTAPYTVPSSGLYYFGCCVVASTVPTLRGPTVQTAAINVAPVLSGSADSSLTNPASAPGTATALTALAGLPWAYAS